MSVRGRTSRLFIGASLLAFVVSPAQAQEAPSPTNEPDENIIMVTANKREQSLQETPIAITAVTQDMVELRGITETKDLAAIAPNVSVNAGTTNSTGVVVTIRGIPAAADEALGFDSPVGIYLDGVYLARTAAASFEIADIQRIEVLRGPQGTLFGRNTTGGAINYITTRPSFDPGLEVKLGYGNYDRRVGRAQVNTGDFGGVRMSLGYLYKEREGFVDNLLEPEDIRDPGGYKTHGARWAVEADLADNLLFTNVFDWTRTKGVPLAAQLSGVGDGTFRPNVTIDGNTFPQVQPAPVGPYLASASILQSQCGTPLSSVSLERLDEICLDTSDNSTDTIYGNMTRFELELDTVTVRSTTAFRWWRGDVGGSDLDGLGTIQGPLFSNATLFNGMPASLLQFVLPPAQRPFAPFIAASPVPTTNQPLFSTTNDRDQNQFTQEIEVIGSLGDNFEYVVGGFYFEETGNERNAQRFSFILDTNQTVFTDAQFGPLAAAFRAANPARYRAVPQFSVLDYTVDAKSYAVYGQGTYRPGALDDRLGLTLGLRYSWDEKAVERRQNGATPFTTPAEIALNTQEASFSEPTGHVTIDYEFSPDLNAYAKASRGYRSGGFNVRQATALDNPATPVDESIPLRSFNEEKIDAYELGAKSTFGPLRLNAAAFYNIYNDLQTSVPIPIVGGGSFGTQVVNAGKIEFLGFEVEGVFELTETVTLDGAFGHVEKYVKEYPAADVNGNLQNVASIITPTNSPDTTANAGISYSDYLGASNTRLTARVGWTYTSSQVYFPNPLGAPFQQETSADSRSLFNAQLRFDSVKLGNGPEFTVLLWGKNILDEEYVARGIDFGQLGFGQILYGEPATYGIDVQFSF